MFYPLMKYFNNSCLLPLNEMPSWYHTAPLPLQVIYVEKLAKLSLINSLIITYKIVLVSSHIKRTRNLCIMVWDVFLFCHNYVCLFGWFYSVPTQFRLYGAEQKRWFWLTLGVRNLKATHGSKPPHLLKLRDA